MDYWENRPAKNMRELFEANLGYLEPEDYKQIRDMLKAADRLRLESLKEVKE
jgi:hypothetical protein